MLLAIDIQSVQRFILFSDLAQKYNNWVRDGFSCQKVKDSDGACRDHLVIRLPTEDVSLPARQPSLVAGCGARSHPAEARYRRQPPHPATRGSPAARLALDRAAVGAFSLPTYADPRGTAAPRGCEGQSPSLSAAMAGNPAEPELAARPAALGFPLAALIRRP